MTMNLSWQTQQLNQLRMKTLQEHAAKERLLKSLAHNQSHVSTQTSELYEEDYLENALIVAMTPA